MKTTALLVVLFSASLLSATQAADAPTPKMATKDAPFVNSLGMKFVPVEITGGPTNGKRILFSVWDTRVQDYAAFAKAKGITPAKPNFEQGPTHPVVMVNWEYAKSFCSWLTDQERAAGIIGSRDEYRLPSDHEWSCAVGIGGMENAELGPWEQNEEIKLYPWGTQWPPPRGFGNYDSSLKVDEFEFTSSVGSFAPNEKGLFDMGGNVEQWCEDYKSYNMRGTDRDLRVTRGESWEAARSWPANEINEAHFRSSHRLFMIETHAARNIGFRCVLAVFGRPDQK
jgi:formylglycine-generating enzyme required for sulfatase activity